VAVGPHTGSGFIGEEGLQLQDELNTTTCCPGSPMNHRDLPASYIKKCKEFFGEVAQEVTSGKPQAVKQQATSRKEKMLEIFIIFTSLFILNMLGVFTVTI
jgi:hypothetical protein